MRTCIRSAGIIGIAGLVLLSLSAWPAAALAQEPDEGEAADEPGPVEAPGPGDEDAPGIDPDQEKRDAIRGGKVPEVREAPAKQQQREWDEQTFGKAGPELRLDADSVAPASHGQPPPRPPSKADVPPELSSHAEAGAMPRRAAPRPEEVRPDLPWLSQLTVGDLPVRWDPRVIRYLEFYKDDPKGRAIMSGWLRDQGRFRGMILEALRRHSLPEDLLYVCMIESAYNPWDLSRVGASGLWQFMPAGGKIYGLEIDFWVDERNDPEKATEAAMLHWRDLYDRFGDWHLALAAYNAGFGAVLRAIATFNTNDFWTLVELENGLPWGSAIYVPKAVAAAIVGHNRKLFGYDTVVEAPPFEFDRVSVDKSVELSVIAKAAGVSTDEVKWYNPELKRGRTPPGVASYSLRLPKGKKEQFARSFPQLRAEWDGYDAYLVRHGERFEDIATEYGVSVKQLRALNGVDDLAELRGGTLIVVPKLDATTRAQNRKKAEDDLYAGGVPAGEPGDPLVVALPDKKLSVKGRKRVFYRVVTGDTLAQVAGALGVSRGELAAWNGLSEEAAVHARMVLVAFVKPEFDPAAAQVALLDDSRLLIVASGSDEHLDLIEGRKGRKRLRVVAKEGETLEGIGKKYNLDKYDMARINRMPTTTVLAAGDEVVVYVITDKGKAKKAGVDKKKKRRTVPKGAGKKSAPKTPKGK